MDIELTEEEQKLVKVGRLIEAIRACRERLGIGLREAKDIVDVYRDKMLGLPPPRPKCSHCGGSGLEPKEGS